MKNAENPNFSSLDSEEKIIYLNSLIDEEFEKADEEKDLDFIDECSKLIMEIIGEGVICSNKNELDKSFEKLLKRYQSEKICSSFAKSTKDDEEHVVKIRFRKIILVATLTIVFIISGTLIISARENNFLSRLFPESFRGTIIKPFGNVTVVENGTEKKYSDFYEFVIDENLGTLRYPDSEKIIIDKIVSNYTDDEKKVEFVPRDCNVVSLIASDKKDFNDYFSVESSGPADYVNPSVLYDDIKEIIQNGTKVTYILINEKHIFIFEYKGWNYCLVTSNYSDGLDVVRILLL